MAEPRNWTPADDQLVRSALATLRRDVEAAPLAEPALVRARGDAHRRRGWLAWGAAATAAGVLAAAVGYATLGRDKSAPAPPATTTTPSTLSPLSQPDALPLAVEWGAILGISSGMQRSTAKGFQGVDCGAPSPGKVVEAHHVRSAFSPLIGRQARFGTEPGQAERLATRFVSELAACASSFRYQPTVSSGWPRVFSYITRGTSGWAAIAASGSDVTYLQIVEPRSGTSVLDQAAFARLADIAQRRLELYGSAATRSLAPTGVATTRTTATEPSSAVTALDEEMPVAGPLPLLDSSLFVAGSQWASAALTRGKQSSAGAGDWEGTASLTQCDADSSTGGRFGIVRVRDSTTGVYFGAQRVRILGSAQAAKDYAAELQTVLARGCDFPNGTNKVTSADREGIYRVDTVFADGSTTFTSFVGYTGMETPNAVTTVVVWGLPDPARGFDEVVRLLALARQK